MVLNFQKWGDPALPPLFLLHGMGGTGKMYRPLAAELEKTWYVIAPDQRGHGASFTKPGDDFTPETFARDLNETFAPLQLKPALVVAHSMGVRTAVHFADLFPEQVGGLALVDLNFSGLAGGGFGRKLEKVLRDLPPTFPSRQEARAYLKDRSPENSVTQFLVAVLEQRGDLWAFPFEREALIHTLEAAQGHSLMPALERVHARGLPTLVVRGGESTVWSHDEFAAYEKQFPKFRFEEIAGAGHGVPFEKREIFTKLLQTVFCSD